MNFKMPRREQIFPNEHRSHFTIDLLINQALYITSGDILMSFFVCIRACHLSELFVGR